MLTVPNLLTLSRIFAVPLLVALLWTPRSFDYLLAFGLYVLIGFTDYLDGYLARKLGTTSRLGAFLDPIADKIMVAAVLLMLVSSRDPDQPPLIADIHIIAAIIILLREIMVSGLREYLAGSQVSVPVTQLAKWKTTMQMIALGALILAGGLPDSPWLLWLGLASLWVAAVLTMLTGWKYLQVGLKHMA